MKQKHSTGTYPAGMFRFFYTAVSILLLLFLPPHPAAAEEQSADTEHLLKIASWNIRIFSTKSRDDDELYTICSLIKNYDFIAIQELRDTGVLDRTVRMLFEKFGRSYEYTAGVPVGRGVKELYAFLYNADKVFWMDKSFSFSDPDDLLIREPFAAEFRAGNFDFYAVTVHLLYGKSVKDRRAEAGYLDDIYTAVQDLDNEQDILLMGDFNLPPDDPGFGELRGIPGMTHINDAGGTTIYGSVYDNIWFQSQFTSEYTGRWGIDRFDENLFGNDDRTASRTVSDHRPLWMTVDTSLPDDD